MNHHWGSVLFVNVVFVVFATSLLTACGEDDAAPALPYDPDETVVIDPDGSVVVDETPDGDGCVELPDGTCVRPQDECGQDDRVDVLRDSEGNVVEIICYPREGETTLVEAEDGSVSVPSNGAVVGLGDGDVEGDLTVDGNNGVVYGDSPDDTIIDGNVSLRGNETTLRGVRVKGDVSFDGNKGIIAYCVVEGDIILSGGANLVTNCTVFGSITSSGNADRIVSNFVQGSIDVTNAEECRDNWGFVDDDQDLILDAEEADAATPLACN